MSQTVRHRRDVLGKAALGQQRAHRQALDQPPGGQVPQGRVNQQANRRSRPGDHGE